MSAVLLDSQRPGRTVQHAVVALLRLYADPNVIWHVLPDGDLQGALSGAKVERHRVLDGLDDITFVFYGRQTCCLEVPKHDGKASPALRKFRAECVATGAPYHITRSLTEVQDILRRWGVVITGEVAR